MCRIRQDEFSGALTSEGFAYATTNQFKTWEALFIGKKLFFRCLMLDPPKSGYAIWKSTHTSRNKRCWGAVTNSFSGKHTSGAEKEKEK
jgi:hypothetical protein